MDKKAIQKLYEDRVQETTRMDPKVAVILGGKTYWIEYNITALLEIRKHTGVDILVAGMGTSMYNQETLSMILHFGLGKSHPAMTLKDVQDDFNVRMLPYYLSRVQLAMELLFPDMSDVEQEASEGRDEDPILAPVNGGTTG